MYISKDASRARQREAQRARDNRAEIVKARSQGQVTRRELVKWGIFTMSGALALKNGLSPYAKSAFAAVPTGVPRSPLFGATKFTQLMPRLAVQTPIPLTPTAVAGDPYPQAAFPSGLSEPNAKKSSYHTDFSYYAGPDPNPFVNPVTGVGPMEGRPQRHPGGTDFFAHQRWNEFFPKVGYVMSLANAVPPPGKRLFHPKFQPQQENKVWTFGPGKFANGAAPPPLIKGRYGEPFLLRVYNNMPVDRTQNGGFGRNESSLHFHNAHNGAESDGATNAHHYPGTFFDYRYTTTLARRDKINKNATDNRASGPNGSGGLVKVAGDYRELQGTMWAHDHRFFFTAENVYKGSLMQINFYSGPDRAKENLNDGVNLRLPSGVQLDSGNTDFDVNLIVSDSAFDPNGQYFFDIFNTDGFLGDVMLVNFAFAPYMNVLPRKYRFRILNACMSRFLKLAFASPKNTAVPFQFIANDGNFVVAPITLTQLDEQGIAERYDIVIDFSKFKLGERIRMVNVLEQVDGKLPKGPLTLAAALGGSKNDPAVGPLLEFRIVSSVPSVDAPGVTLTVANSCGTKDFSKVPSTLTGQIDIVTPVRTRVVEFKRKEPNLVPQDAGPCVPDCGNGTPTDPFKEELMWAIRVNGEDTHSLNANRISLLIPKPGEVEHWTYINGGGGWDHPIHLHFEEGITMSRKVDDIPVPLPATENLVRKDVWRLRPSGEVKFQVQFGEFGGAYVNHCHNTVHEDFGMLLRYQLLTDGSFDPNEQPQLVVTPTPNPTPAGIVFTTPEILPEGDPRSGA